MKSKPFSFFLIHIQNIGHISSRYNARNTHMEDFKFQNFLEKHTTTPLKEMVTWDRPHPQNAQSVSLPLKNPWLHPAEQQYKSVPKVVFKTASKAENPQCLCLLRYQWASYLKFQKFNCNIQPNLYHHWFGFFCSQEIDK